MAHCRNAAGPVLNHPRTRADNLTTHFPEAPMQEQITPPIKVDSEFALNQAISDLKFYWGLARHKGVPFEVEIWAERGAIVCPQLIQTTRRNSDEASTAMHGV